MPAVFPQQYFSRSHVEWEVCGFRACYPELPATEVNNKWIDALQTIANTCELGDEQRLKAGKLLDKARAEQYFTKVKPANWNINNFLHQNLTKLHRSDLASAKVFLCDAWLRGLHRAEKETSDADRKLVTRLLHRFNTYPHYDRDSVDMLFQTIGSLPTAFVPHLVGSDAPSITIHGNSNTTSTGNRKRKRHRTETHDRPNTSTSNSRSYLKEFTRNFNSFSDSHKWPLPCGVDAHCEHRYVEDLLYNHFKNAEREGPVHSWVIDTSDQEVMGLFCKTSREIILERVPPLPQTERWFVDALLPYSEQSGADGLKAYLYQSPPLPRDQNIPLEQHPGRIWIDNVMRCWSGLLSGPGGFTRDHKVWYTSNFWGTVYDNCMGTVSGSYMSRGESKSRGTSLRKNTIRPPSRGHRQRVGHLYDGVLTLNGYEVGVAEHSKRSAFSYRRKWTNDRLKVVKALHDMLHGLQTVVSLRGHAGPQVQGISTAGWLWQTCRMAIGGGYICILVSDRERVVPSTYDAVGEFLCQVAALWAYRNVLHGCMNSINAKPNSSDEMRALLLGALVVDGPVIPKSVETETETDDTSDSDLE